MNSLLLALILAAAPCQFALRVERVIDGDTVVGVVEFPLGTLRRIDVRLHGFDAWESRFTNRNPRVTASEIPKGKAATADLQKLLDDAKQVTAAFADDRGREYGSTFSRVEARVFVDGHDVGEVMRAKGHERQAK